MMATANPTTETSSCCGARVTYSGDGQLCCKACWGALEWKGDPGAPFGIDTYGTYIRIPEHSIRPSLPPDSEDA